MVSYQRYGGMAEWLKAAVLKTVEPQGSVGSNPTSSASEAPTHVLRYVRFLFQAQNPQGGFEPMRCKQPSGLFGAEARKSEVMKSLPRKDF